MNNFSNYFCFSEILYVYHISWECTTIIIFIHNIVIVIHSFCMSLIFTITVISNTFGIPVRETNGTIYYCMINDHKCHALFDDHNSPKHKDGYSVGGRARIWLKSRYINSIIPSYIHSICIRRNMKHLNKVYWWNSLENIEEIGEIAHYCFHMSSDADDSEFVCKWERFMC